MERDYLGFHSRVAQHMHQNVTKRNTSKSPLWQQGMKRTLILNQGGWGKYKKDVNWSRSWSSSRNLQFLL
jgi:hypothetical protein